MVKIILNSLNSVNFHIYGYLWQWDYKFTKDTNGKGYFLEQISINTYFELNKVKIHNSPLASKEKTIVVSRKITYKDIYKNCVSMKEKFCSAAIKVGKKPWAVQLPLLKYKQFSSNINGKVIDFNEDWLIEMKNRKIQ